MLKAQPQLVRIHHPTRITAAGRMDECPCFDLGLSEQAATPPVVQAVPLLTLDEVAVLPAGTPWRRRPMLQVQDFANQPFVSLSADDPTAARSARFAGLAWRASTCKPAAPY